MPLVFEKKKKIRKKVKEQKNVDIHLKDTVNLVKVFPCNSALNFGISCYRILAYIYMCVCVCVCLCVYIYIYVCIYVCIYMYIYIFLRICMYIYLASKCVYGKREERFRDYKNTSIS